MSIKFYVAYRLPVDKLNDLFKDIHPKIYRKAALKINKNSEVITKKHYVEYKSDDNAFLYREKYKNFESFGCFLYLAEKASKEYRVTPFDLEYSLNIWLYNNLFYIIPIDNLNNDINFPSYCKDYSYWNNTDRPNDISYEEWEERSLTWDRVCLDNYNQLRMNHPIIRFDNYGLDYYVEKEIFEIYKGLKNNKK